MDLPASPILHHSKWNTWPLITGGQVGKDPSYKTGYANTAHPHQGNQPLMIQAQFSTLYNGGDAVENTSFALLFWLSRR